MLGYHTQVGWMLGYHALLYLYHIYRAPRRSRQTRDRAVRGADTARRAARSRRGSAPFDQRSAGLPACRRTAPATAPAPGRTRQRPAPRAVACGRRAGPPERRTVLCHAGGRRLRSRARLVRVRVRVGVRGSGRILRSRAHLRCHGGATYSTPEAGTRTAYVPWRTSCPAPQVRTLRRRLVRVARTYCTEATGRTSQLSSSRTIFGPNTSLLAALARLHAVSLGASIWAEPSTVLLIKFGAEAII